MRNYNKLFCKNGIAVEVVVLFCLIMVSPEVCIGSCTTKILIAKYIFRLANFCD